MAVARDPRTGRTDADTSTSSGVLSSVSRYDLVLAAIPAAFLVAAVVGGLLALPVPGLVGVASLIAGVGVVDALVFNPPVSGDRQPTRRDR